MTSPSRMTKSFVERAKQIKNTFSQSDDDKSAIADRSINEKISYILDTCPEKILDKTKHKVKNPNLLLLILLYEDISKIYNESSIPRSGNLKKMKRIKEDFKTLALIGDRALELGILPIIWEEEDKSGDIPAKGNLDEKKKNFVRNKNLAKIWDNLGLYDEEILTQKKRESQDLKGSRMEAIFGIIYLEGGLESVEVAIDTLKT